MITFAFTSQVQYVSSIGFLNVGNSDTVVTVTTSEAETTMRVPNIGKNSVQTLLIETEFVSTLKITLGGLSAITFIEFCYNPETAAPNFVGPPAAPTPVVTPTVPTPALPTSGVPTPALPTSGVPTPGIVPTPVPPISTLPTPASPTPVTVPTIAGQPTPVTVPTPAAPSSTTPPPISVCVEAVCQFRYAS